MDPRDSFARVGGLARGETTRPVFLEWDGSLALIPGARYVLPSAPDAATDAGIAAAAGGGGRAFAEVSNRVLAHVRMQRRQPAMMSAADIDGGHRSLSPEGGLSGPPIDAGSV